MSLVNLSRLEIKVGSYATGPASALSDPVYVQTARKRRMNIRRMTKAFDADIAKARIPEGEYLVSRKVDGEYTCLLFKDGEVATVNPGGTVRVGAPFMDEAAKLLSAAGIKDAIIGGELYVVNPDRKRPSVHDVVRIARAPKSNSDLDMMQFAVFDIYQIDGEDFSAPYSDVFKKIKEIFSGTKVHPVETVSEENADGVLKRFKAWVLDEGEEGVVARSDDMGSYKVKPRHSLDLAVVGFSEGVDERANMLHSLLMAVVREDGTYHMAGHVGGGFSDAQRVQILDQLSEQVTDSEYVEVNSHHVAYRMIKPGPVIEISCLDLISRGSLGDPIDRMVLEWNVEKSCWEVIRKLAFASIISPQFQHFRDDKTPSAADTGLKQLTDITEIPDADIKAEDLKLPASTVMKRIVAKKEYRGATMVRKLLVWKTNKEAASPNFPAYVLHLTDYSPSRKDPLKHDIRVSASEEQILSMFEAWQEKNFVKGWEVLA